MNNFIVEGYGLNGKYESGEMLVTPFSENLALPGEKNGGSTRAEC